MNLSASAVLAAVTFARSWLDRSTGLLWLVGQDCTDFETYERWPRVVDLQGKRFVKTGWNSDFATVHYREATASDLVAFPVVH